MASILLVDADKTACRRARDILADAGHDVAVTRTADDAIAAFERQAFDLVLVDWMLQGDGGPALLERLRRDSDAAPMRIMTTSARGRVKDIIAAFDAGADDFVAKPFVAEELVARVGALFMRPLACRAKGTTRAGGISIDNLSQRVFVDGNRVSLAPREYQLLLFLMTNRDRVFSRRQLLSNVWQQNAGVGSRTVDVHIRRLRGILEPFGYDRFLQTVRGSGYRFSPGS